MLSLNQLRAEHSSLLVIDSASSQIQVGFFPARGIPRWISSDDEAGVGIFRCVEKLNVPIVEVSGFVFCEGPGSVLGIRTAAMALRTWTMLSPRPLFSYLSLGLVATALNRAEVGVIADARREMWHEFKLGQSLRRIPGEQLCGELVTPEGFRQWSKPPSQVRTTPYRVEQLFTETSSIPLFRRKEAPDAFLHEEPSYLTWTPRIHQRSSG